MRNVLLLHVLAQLQTTAVTGSRGRHNLRYLSWFGSDFPSSIDSATPPVTSAHANLYRSNVLENITAAWTRERLPGLLTIQSCTARCITNCSSWHTTCPRIIRHDRSGLSADWQTEADALLARLAPLAPRSPAPLGGAVRGVMLGDELVMGGFPLSNLTSLANYLARRLRPMGVFIFTNEGFRWGNRCNATRPCISPSGAGPE
jgi:hypothetical protein